MRRRALLQAGSVTALAALAGCAAFSGDNDFETWTPDEGWPLTAFGPRNTGYSQFATPPRSTPEWVQSVETDNRVHSLVAGGNSIVVGTETNVQTYDQDLESEWTAPDGGKVAAIRDGTVYAAGHTDDGTVVHAHSLADGSRQWRTTYGDSDALTHLIPTAGAVLLTDSTIMAFSPSDGARKWTHDTPAPVHHAVGNGALYFATTGLGKATLRSGLDEIQHGPLKTTELLDTPRIQSPLTSIDDRLYCIVTFPSDGGVVVAFEDGREQWRTPIGVSSYTGQAVDHDAAYAAGVRTSEDRIDGGLLGAYALNAEGREQWQKETNGWIHAPILTGGNGTAETVLAYGGGEGGNIYAFDANDGTQLWNVETTAEVDAIAPVGSRVYAGTRDGTVFALA